MGCGWFNRYGYAICNAPRRSGAGWLDLDAERHRRCWRNSTEPSQHCKGRRLHAIDGGRKSAALQSDGLWIKKLF